MEAVKALQRTRAPDDAVNERIALMLMAERYWPHRLQTNFPSSGLTS
jgi:hypothetical protein